MFPIKPLLYGYRKKTKLLTQKKLVSNSVVRDYIFTLDIFASQLIQQKKSLSLSLITSTESISAPSSFVTIASFASNPNFSPVEEDTIYKQKHFSVLRPANFLSQTMYTII